MFFLIFDLDSGQFSLSAVEVFIEGEFYNFIHDRYGYGKWRLFGNKYIEPPGFQGFNKRVHNENGSINWERQIVVGAEREDLDDKLIKETATMAVKAERWQGSSEDIEGFLHALGLSAHGGVTNAALLLFGKQPSRLLPQARVRLLVMPEGKIGNRYSVDKTFDACLLRIAEQIPDALASHTGGVLSRFSQENWQREDHPLYPMIALREGVMNALVHRDYSLSGSVSISIYPDSLQITNPGSLVLHRLAKKGTLRRLARR